MKVFKFHCGDIFYAYSGKDEQQAKDALMEEHSPKMIGKIEEIPESKWDEKFIQVHEDNDHSKEPFQISIREAMLADYPELIFTNDIID